MRVFRALALARLIARNLQGTPEKTCFYEAQDLRNWGFRLGDKGYIFQSLQEELLATENTSEVTHMKKHTASLPSRISVVDLRLTINSPPIQYSKETRVDG